MAAWCTHRHDHGQRSARHPAIESDTPHTHLDVDEL